MLDLAPAADRLRLLLPGAAERLDAPTPCTESAVGDLLDHVMLLTLAFRLAADKTDDPVTRSAPPPASSSRLDPDWPTLLPERLDALVSAWREPEAWQGTTRAGGLEMPAGQAGVVALDELVMHGWDLARALGKDYRCDPASVEAVHSFVSSVPPEPQARQGLFGPVVAVPAGAPLFDRALGLAGRNPGWAPPATERPDEPGLPSS